MFVFTYVCMYACMYVLPIQDQKRLKEAVHTAGVPDVKSEKGTILKEIMVRTKYRKRSVIDTRRNYLLETTMRRQPAEQIFQKLVS